MALRIPVSTRAVRRRFDQLRKRYYMDAEPPLRIPPLAKDVKWVWVDRGRTWAQTWIDEDNDPYTVEVNILLRESERFLNLILLHELSHMRNPDVECGSRCAWWREEGLRLGAAGAFAREGIF